MKLIIIVLVLVIILYFIFRHNFKILKVPSVCLVTGGVKTGKSLLSVNLSYKDYRSLHRKWFLVTKLFHKEIEEPLFYTNVFFTFGNSKHKHFIKDYDKSLGGFGVYFDEEKQMYFRYHKLDKNIRFLSTDELLRLKRFNYKSIIYIQEASLMADNMDYQNVIRNIDLSLFAKLIAHETRGGKLYLDTQSVLDVHYSFKRVSSSYLFIQKNRNFLLFRVLYVREMINTENGVNNFDDDIEMTMRKVLIPFWYYYRYDRYEYSYLTDDLDKNNKPFERYKGLVSFNDKYIARSDKRKEFK